MYLEWKSLACQPWCILVGILDLTCGVFDLEALWPATVLQGSCSELMTVRLVLPSGSLLDTSSVKGNRPGASFPGPPLKEPAS